MAEFNHLILELKNHEKLQENTDLLISQLRQKGLLHEDVSGSTVHDRAEKLIADLNQATSDGCSESFLGDLLDVLENIPAFNNITGKFRTNTEPTKPQQEIGQGNGINYDYSITESKRRVKSLVDSFLISKQEKSPEPFSMSEESMLKRHEASDEITGSISQKESHKTSDTAISSQNGAYIIRSLRIFNIGYKLEGTELAEDAEQQIEKLETEQQTEELGLHNQIQKLREKISELDRKIKGFEFIPDLGVEIIETLTEAKEKVCVFLAMVNQLELEKRNFQTRVDELESEKGDLRMRVDELQSEKGDLQMRVNKLESEWGDLQARVEHLELKKEESSLSGRS